MFVNVRECTLYFYDQFMGKSCVVLCCACMYIQRVSVLRTCIFPIFLSVENRFSAFASMYNLHTHMMHNSGVTEYTDYFIFYSCHMATGVCVRAFLDFDFIFRLGVLKCVFTRLLSRARAMNTKITIFQCIICHCHCNLCSAWMHSKCM